MRTTKICFFLIVFVLGFSCYKQSDFEKSNTSVDEVILRIIPGRNMLLANDKDTTVINVELPVDTRDTLPSVTFFVDKGMFLESGKNTITVGAGLIKENSVQRRFAKATYQSSLDTGSVTITVSVSYFSKISYITLSRNAPEKISVIPSSLSLKSDPFSEVTFSVLLSSSKGRVTRGYVVDLNVKDSSGIGKGSFRAKNITSDDSGICSFVYSIMPDTAFSGKLYVHASVPNSTLSDSTIIYVIK